MNPYIPTKKSRLAIIDYRANDKIIHTLEKRGLEVVKSIKCDELLEPVNGHPDMVVHPIDFETVIVAPNVYDYYYEMLSKKGIKVIKGGKTLSINYPNDIAYNVARIGKYAIHNIKYTDEIIKYYLQKSDIRFIHVNQGYSKCSTACLNDNKAITSDITIYNALTNLGIQCLYFNPKDIILKGFGYGFIGGSIGLIDEKTLLLTGEIKDETANKELVDFAKGAGVEILVSSDDLLTDLGTIIVM